MKILGHGNGDVQVEGVRVAAGVVQDQIAGDTAVGDFDGDARVAAESGAGVEVADGGSRKIDDAGVQRGAGDGDLTAGHGRGQRQTDEVRRCCREMGARRQGSRLSLRVAKCNVLAEVRQE